MISPGSSGDASAAAALASAACSRARRLTVSYGRAFDTASAAYRPSSCSTCSSLGLNVATSSRSTVSRPLASPPDCSATIAIDRTVKRSIHARGMRLLVRASSIATGWPDTNSFHRSGSTSIGPIRRNASHSSASGSDPTAIAG